MRPNLGGRARVATHPGRGAWPGQPGRCARPFTQLLTVAAVAWVSGVPKRPAGDWR